MLPLDTSAAVVANLRGIRIFFKWFYEAVDDRCWKSAVFPAFHSEGSCIRRALGLWTIFTGLTVVLFLV